MDENYDSFWNTDVNNDQSKRFLHLLNNNFFSDVTFLIGRNRKRVPGHSLVLSLCSWDFFNVFKLLKLDRNEIILEDVEYEVFMVFLEYCYTLNIDFGDDDTLEKTLEILKLAQRFHFKSLVETCNEHIIKTKLSSKNAMIIYKNKKILSDDISVSEKLRYIIENYFSSIIQIQSNLDIFLELSLEEIRYFAELSPIQCDEMEMFDVLMKWAKKNCEKNGIPSIPRYLRMILKDVFYEIRFPTMKTSWFTEILSQYPEMFSNQEITYICCKMNKNPVIGTDFWRFKCEPRKPINVIYKMFPFGTNANFFKGVPDMDNGTTKQMISKFCAKETRNLIGFAFVAKKNEMVNVTSCKLKISYREWKDIAISPGGRTKFNWDYDLIAMKFNETEEILARSSSTCGYYIQLLCEFDKDVPNLSSKISPIAMQHNGIEMQMNEPNAIPYLILTRK